MFHVLEHVENPVNVLKRLREVSAEGGMLVVEVPLAEFGETNDINGFLAHNTLVILLNTHSIKRCWLRVGQL